MRLTKKHANIMCIVESLITEKQKNYVNFLSSRSPQVLHVLLEWVRVKVVDACGCGQGHNCSVGKNWRLIVGVNESKRSPIASRRTEEQLRL